MELIHLLNKIDYIFNLVTMFKKDKYIFKDSEITLEKTKFKDIDKNIYINWNKNRPPDENRVDELCKYYKENNVNIVPGVIYCWKNDDKYEIYDGIHRYLSCIKYNNPEMILLIHTNNTKKESYIKEEFLNLNKSICVPSIYLEENNYYKRIVSENVSKELCKKYPSFVSPARKPFQYNFNRDNLIEFISELQIDFSKYNIDKTILNILNSLNYESKEYVKRNSIKVPKKCEYSNFYLFFLDKSYIKSKIEELI